MGTSIDFTCARHSQNVCEYKSVVLCDVVYHNPQKLTSCMEPQKCNQYPIIYNDCEWQPAHVQYLVERIIDCHHRHFACMKLFWMERGGGSNKRLRTQKAPFRCNHQTLSTLLILTANCLPSQFLG